MITLAPMNTKQVVANLSALTDKANQVGAMADALNIVRDELSVFPPQPDRQRAKTFNGWVRERGRFPKSTFITAGGKARKRPNLGGAMGKPPSEQLLAKLKSANIQVTITSDALRGIIILPGTYFNNVIGTAQPAYHAATGWKTVRQVYLQNYERIAMLFVKAMLKKG